MIWLTWRQFRSGALMMAAALALLAVVLGLTGPGLADQYADGVAACARNGDCAAFDQRFFDDNLTPFLAVTAIVLVLPALVGVFWGAPLIARELEAGTHRLVWNQSVTPTRWLAVKVGLVGLAAMVVAGVGTLAVTWWSSPVDDAAADLPRLEPLLFAARGLAPVGYAAFAFALGVTVGMLARRTLPAMAITLAIFVAAQIAMPLLVRPHLLAPTRTTVEITPANIDGFVWGPDDVLEVSASGASADAWVLSSHIVDADGNVVDPLTVPSSSGPCADPPDAPSAGGPEDDPGIAACLAEIEQLGYRLEATYHPASRFWPLQWFEAGIYTALALGLAGFCAWRIRRRLP
jgi:hypothetical protein